MADTVLSSGPLLRASLVEYISSGAKPASEHKIGAEHEKFGFARKTLARPAYEGEGGVHAMLTGLMQFGWSGVYEGQTLIGLERNGASVSLEPGGQLELSGASLSDVHQIHAETLSHLQEVEQVAKGLDVGYIGTGFSPLWTREETPVMPKGRYDIMRAYMPKVGKLGLDMMLRTCTIQSNLDFSSEADMVKKFRMSLALQPVATALFANSPFTEGKPNGFLSARANVWTDTDADRTGLLDFVFDEGFGFEAYVDYALDVPMYFVKRDRYIDASGLSFRDFLDGKLSVLPGQYPLLKDWADHLTTLFPEVRLKKYLEMRGADGGPLERITALQALWAGIFYDPSALEAAYQLALEFTAQDRLDMRAEAAKRGLKGKAGSRTIQDVAKDMLAIARQGLKARAKAGVRDGVTLSDETAYLDCLDAIADSGITPAERLLDLYHGPWGGKVEPLYVEETYF